MANEQSQTIRNSCQKMIHARGLLLNSMSIRVNRVLSKKQNIAGIPADIFLPIVAFDTVAMVFLCLCFGLPAIPLAICCLTINIVWAILVAKGVWRFLGTFYHPPRYYRRNIHYNPFLQESVDRKLFSDRVRSSENSAYKLVKSLNRLD